MEDMECNDLCDLYEFYQEFRFNISLLQFNREHYDKILSQNHYAQNILYVCWFIWFEKRWWKKYGEFYRQCINIIKSVLKNREKRREQENK